MKSENSTPAPVEQGRLHCQVPQSLIEEFDAWWRARPHLKSRSDGVRELMESALHPQAKGATDAP